MHISLLTDSMAPSGVGTHMLTLAEGLRARHTLSLAAPDVPAAQALLHGARALGIRVRALPVSEECLTHEGLRDWLTEARPDLFHVHAGVGWEGLAAVWWGREVGTPAVVRTEHLPYLLTDPEQASAYRWLIPLVDRILCVSETARQSYLEAGVPPGKLRLARNGVPLPALPQGAGPATLGSPSAMPLVLTIARFSEQKGHCFLLDAVPLVQKRVPGVRFLWVGEGPLREPLEAEVARRGLGNTVCFLGRRDDVPALLAAADLFVLPSLFEGLPLAVLEAMAAAKPVVATHVTGTMEAIEDGHTGRLVPPADSAALAAAIIEALTEPARAARWSAAARRLVEAKFGAARMVEGVVGVYEEVVGAAQPLQLVHV